MFRVFEAKTIQQWIIVVLAVVTVAACNCNRDALRKGVTQPPVLNLRNC